jgi:hypothetical protein
VSQVPFLSLVHIGSWAHSLPVEVLFYHFTIWVWGFSFIGVIVGALIRSAINARVEK